MLLKNSRGDMFSWVPPLRADISRESSAGVFLRAGICLGVLDMKILAYMSVG